MLERFCADKQQGSVRDTDNEAPYFACPLQIGAAFDVEERNGYEGSAYLSSGGNGQHDSLLDLEPFKLGNDPTPTFEGMMEILTVIRKTV